MLELILISFQDPSNNGMKKWKGLRGHGNTGVVEVHFPTSPYCTTGDWKIEVTVHVSILMFIFSIL